MQLFEKKEDRLVLVTTIVSYWIGFHTQYGVIKGSGWAILFGFFTFIFLRVVSTYVLKEKSLSGLYYLHYTIEGSNHVVDEQNCSVLKISRSDSPHEYIADLYDYKKDNKIWVNKNPSKPIRFDAIIINYRPRRMAMISDDDNHSIIAKTIAKLYLFEIIRYGESIERRGKLQKLSDHEICLALDNDGENDKFCKLSKAKTECRKLGRNECKKGICQSKRIKEYIEGVRNPINEFKKIPITLQDIFIQDIDTDIPLKSSQSEEPSLKGTENELKAREASKNPSTIDGSKNSDIKSTATPDANSGQDMARDDVTGGSST